MQWTDRIGRRLKLRDLHILLAVAESRSMVKAAERLSISQPVVSKAIADLEHTLGVRLLDRNPHGIEPTIYGRTLFDSSIAAFDDLQQGVKQIAFLADPTTGEVHVGCTEPIAAGLLAPIIERLGRQYPRVVCHVAQITATAALEYRELRERQVDLVLARIAAPFTEQDLHAEVLYYEHTYVVAGKRSKWARRQKIELSELVNEPWLQTLPNTIPNTIMEEAFRACGLQVPRASVVSFSIHLPNTLLPTGRYLAMVPGSLLRYGMMANSVKALPVRLLVGPGPVGIVTLKNRTLNPVAKLFIEAARAVAKPLTKSGTAAGMR